MGYSINGLKEKLQELIDESRDMQFTNYLQKAQSKVNKMELDIDSIGKEVEKNYGIYMKRMENYDSKKEVQSQVHQRVAPVEVDTKAEINNIQATVPVERTPEVKTTVKKSNSSIEFKIGAWVFSVIGAIFVLVSFGILGTNYMDGMLKGLSLYAISAVIILISELIFRKKMRGFSFAVTAIGTVGLFISTVINYSVLHNFNGIVAGILTAIISIITLLLSKRKQSGTFELISFAGMNMCFYPLFSNFSDINFYIIIAIILVLNVVIIIAPVKKMPYQINILHMLVNIIVAVIVIAMGFENNLYNEGAVVFLCVMILIQNIIFVKQVYVTKKIGLRKDTTGYTVANAMVYCITAGILYLTIGIFLGNRFYFYEATKWGALVVIAAINIITFIGLFHSKLKWTQYHIMNAFIYLVFLINYDTQLSYLIAVLGIFFVSKLLARVKALKVSELLITIFTSLLVIQQGFFVGVENDYLILTAAMIVSILFLYHWRSLYQCIILFTIGYSILAYFDIAIALPLVVVITLIGILLFANVPFFKGKCNVVFNILSIIGVGGLYLVFPFIDHNILTYICMVVFGVTLLMFVFQKKYGLQISNKALVISLFLTYMCFCLQVPMSFIISIGLVVIAIGSISSGFILNQKAQRIYGIVLVLFTCLKVVLWDFVGIDTLAKIILFLVVGLLVLAISGIYIMLEKKVQ